MPRRRPLAPSAAGPRAVLPAIVLALVAVGCGGESAVEGPVLTIRAAPAPSSRGPEAAAIRRAFAALRDVGLRSPDRRDDTDACEQLGCVARIVSRNVSITAWPDAEAAAGAAGHRVGPYGVTFATSRVPEPDRAGYLRVVREAVR